MAFTTFTSHDLNQKSISEHVKLIATHLGLFEGGQGGLSQKPHMFAHCFVEWKLGYPVLSTVFHHTQTGDGFISHYI